MTRLNILFFPRSPILELLHQSRSFTLKWLQLRGYLNIQTLGRAIVFSQRCGHCVGCRTLWHVSFKFIAPAVKGAATLLAATLLWLPSPTMMMVVAGYLSLPQSFISAILQQTRFCSNLCHAKCRRASEVSWNTCEMSSNPARIQIKLVCMYWVTYNFCCLASYVAYDSMACNICYKLIDFSRIQRG